MNAAAPNEILIHMGEQGWLATYAGPHAAHIGELFDTCTVPTAFTARAALSTVFAAVAALNPGVTVRHWIA